MSCSRGPLTGFTRQQQGLFLDTDGTLLVLSALEGFTALIRAEIETGNTVVVSY